jgi:hypothetical protein
MYPVPLNPCSVSISKGGSSHAIEGWHLDQLTSCCQYLSSLTPTGQSFKTFPLTLTYCLFSAPYEYAGIFHSPPSPPPPQLLQHQCHFYSEY